VKPELTLIPTLSIYPDRICYFNEPHWNPIRPGKRIAQDQAEIFEDIEPVLPHAPEPQFSHLITSDRTAHGKVSNIARRKLGKCIDYLLLLSSERKVYSRMTGRQFSMKIAFVTLTLPAAQIHSDIEIKSKCLNQFLIELKKRYKVARYVWRAEKQQNGNIHFHVLIDRFVPWQSLRDCWNRIVNKLGYVDRYREELKKWHASGFKVRKELLKNWDYKSQLKAYRNGVANDWNSPNSTDIHSIRKIINVKAYIAKYLTKNGELDRETGEFNNPNLAQTGRIWGCSQDLSKAKGARVIVDSHISDELKKIVDSNNFKSYHADYFSVLYIKFNELHHLGANCIFEAFASYLLNTFDFNVQLQL
jgi:hypothetical protein